MAIAFSYNKEYAKISITGLTPGTTYSIYSTGIPGTSTMYSGYTLGGTIYNYFVSSGVTHSLYVVSNGTTAGSTTVYVDFDNSFLINSDTAKSQQISILYDENISSVRPVRKDFVQETIGSKYPFVIRNAAIDYETMEFSGMITSLMDQENFSGYGSSQYTNTLTSIYSKERAFRDWFVSWINDGAPKVLKTASEGNKIVRVHNVGLTPVRQTGRVIYTFSCTLTEIADYTLNNLTKYKFL